MVKIFVVRIAGQVKNLEKQNETMRRLKLGKKFAARFVDSEDKVLMGMVKAVDKKVAYGEVSAEFVKELDSKRLAKDGIYFLHPPRGGFKKSTRLPTPKGVLGKHKDFDKLVGRML